MKVLAYILLAWFLVMMTLMCFSTARADFPRGYWAHGRAVAKIQQRVYGLRVWSSLLLAQIEQESGWRSCPTSPVGARGLTQFMPGTQRAIESKYGRRGDACDPEHAALLQSLLMKENAWQCGTAFRGFRPVWFCSLRTYNGSPRNFWKEWIAAGQPCCSTVALERHCARFRRAAHCRENIEYPHRIFNRWPKYAEVWGS